MVYEYEIKCSYQDFKADFKKQDKHNKLSGSYYKNPIVSPYKNIRLEFPKNLAEDNVCILCTKLDNGEEC